MSAEYPAATWVPIPGFGFPTGAHDGNDPRWIVLHGTSSTGATAQNIAHYFQGDNQNGTHFVIGKDGSVIQMVALLDAAYGNGGPTAQELAAHAYASFWQPEIDAGTNLNTCTISIEHCKDSGNQEALTPAQQDASFKLVAWLCKTLNIPARQADASGGITGHFSINGIERVNCPGPYPWAELFNFLEGDGIMPGVPAGWTDDGATLTAPNGQTVTGAFRAYIIETGWDATDYPLEAQEHVAPLEQGNTSLGAGLRQTFRKTRLEWTDAQVTPFTGVLVCWLGQEALALEKAQPAPGPSAGDELLVAVKKALNLP